MTLRDPWVLRSDLQKYSQDSVLLTSCSLPEILTFDLTMKRTVLLLALYILLKPAVPVIDFVVNYGYIVAELCINRDKPELECNGNCYLKKELAKASQDENPISQDRKIPMPGSELFFKAPVLEYPIKAPETYTKTLLISPNTNYLQQEIDDIFRPPIFIS